MKMDVREKTIRSWFEMHVATVGQMRDVRTHKIEGEAGIEAFKDVDILEWKRPGTGAYGIWYLSFGSTLFVQGDLGQAVYRVSSSSGFDFWADCDLGYFSSKCDASENGRMFEEWDDQVLIERIKYQLNQDCTNKTWKDFEDKYGTNHTGSEKEWYVWLCDYGADFFGEPDCFPSGKAVSLRCQAHLIGLKMAMAQLGGSVVIAPPQGG